MNVADTHKGLFRNVAGVESIRSLRCGILSGRFEGFCAPRTP
jgi:hypothetical protein